MRNNLYVLCILLLLVMLLPQPASGATKPVIHVGLILANDDGSDPWTYDGMAVSGLRMAENKYGVVGHILPYDNPPMWIQYCGDNYDLCISVGFQTAEAARQAAEMGQYADKYFAVMDHWYDQYPPNLQSVWMLRDEEGYLAGYLAGLMTAGDVVGVVGGMEIQPVVDLAEGYRRGAQCANPQANVLITYTGEFGNWGLGETTAQAMIDQGADVIFSAAGYTGSGAIHYAAGQGKWAIGVDTDEFYSTFAGGAEPGSELLLTSAVNRLDVAVYHTIGDFVKNGFTPGLRLGGLAQGETSLAPYHLSASVVPKAVQDQMLKLQKDIIKGKVDVGASCP